MRVTVLPAMAITGLHSVDFCIARFQDLAVWLEAGSAGGSFEVPLRALLKGYYKSFTVGVRGSLPVT